MTLVGVNPRGELLRYEFGSGKPIVHVPIPELEKQRQSYLCQIWPIGDQTYVVQTTKSENYNYDADTPRSQVFVVGPDRSKRLERWMSRYANKFTDQTPYVFDQNPVAPEIILVAWKSSNESYSVLQVWSVLPTLELLDEWPLEDFVYGGRFPEAWPVEREDILIELSTTNKDRLRPKEVTVPLSAAARLTGDWTVTPYGRTRTEWQKSFLGPLRAAVVDYGFGTVPLKWYGVDTPYGWVGHPYYRLRTADNGVIDSRGALVKHLYDVKTKRLSPVEIPDAFITGRDITETKRPYYQVLDKVSPSQQPECVIIDTVDLDWTGQRLEPILTALLRSSDLAGYVLRAYRPSAIFPGMKTEPRPWNYQSLDELLPRA